MPATVSEHGNQIRDFYQKYLGRPAVASEVGDWVGTGKNINEIEAGLRDHALANPAPAAPAAPAAPVATPTPTAPTAGQIRDLYQQNFGREAVDEEVQDWQGTGMSANEVEAGIADHWEAGRYRQTGTAWPGAASVQADPGPEIVDEPEEEEEEGFDWDFMSNQINEAVGVAMRPYNDIFNSSQATINDLSDQVSTAQGERDVANAGWEEAVDRANSYRENSENTQLSGLRSGSTVSGRHTSPYAGIVGGSPSFSSDEDNRVDATRINAEDSVLANKGPVVSVMDGRSSLTGGGGARGNEDNRRRGLTSGGSGTIAHYAGRFG